MEWQKGKPMRNPKISKRYFYETIAIDKNMQNEYKEKYIESDILPSEQNYIPFTEHISKSKNRNVVAFDSLDKTTKLLIPMPRKNKNFATIKDFINNSTKKQQIEFWKKVAIEVKKMLKKYNKVYVNTHGLGVSYFHLRIDTTPKYYKTQVFINS